MMKLRHLLRTAIPLVLLAGIIWYFAHEIERHWNDLSHVQLDFHWQYLLLGLMLVVVGYLIATLAWRDAVHIASGKQLTFVESVGLVNISQLTKYIPGKVWSYAIQMHLLSAHGISKTRVLSVNIIMLLSLTASATTIGLGYLASAGTLLPRELGVPLFVSSLTLYLLFVFGGPWSVNLVIRLINALFKKNLAFIKVPTIGMIQVHGLYLGSNLMFGLAGYFVALGIGLNHDLSLLIPIAGSMLLSDTIGLFAFVVPGGIGVRESVMYAMLKSAVDIQICFMLPVAFRLVTTISDLLLGGAAMILLGRFAKRDRGEK
jgi:hypothetical protein